MDKRRTKASQSKEKIGSSAKIWPPIGAKAPDRSRSGRERPDDGESCSREEGATVGQREKERAADEQLKFEELSMSCLGNRCWALGSTRT